MATRSERAVVLGADIEGLAAAATLAAAGKEVHLFDGLTNPGGAGGTLEFHPGHHVPGLFNETALVRRKLIAGLGLEQLGLKWKGRESPLHVLRDNGEVLTILRHSLAGGQDTGSYARWRAWVDRMAPLVCEVLDDAPPEAADPGVMDLFSLARKGFKLRTLGEKDMMELLRIVTMPAWDWMEENFEDPALRAGLVSLTLPGTVVGPRAAGTTAMLLMQEAGRGVEPEGGLAAVVSALVARCDQLGVQMQLGVQPERIHADSSAQPGVQSVELSGGRRVDAGLVVSTLDPKRTLLELVQPGLIPLHVEAEVEGWRMRGSSAVYLLAFSSAIELPGGAERLITASTPEELERAADALKYRQLPASPWLDIRNWSRESEGPGTLSIHVHGVPHELDGGWTDAARGDLRDRLLAALETAVPGARESLVGERLLTPVDLEAEFGLRGGQLHGGEEVLDQLWVQRPALSLCRYETPLEGLFLGGAGCHPGGAFVGGAGVLAARRALGR